MAFAAGALLYGAGILALFLTGHHPHFAGGAHRAGFFGLVVATLVMARREHRSLAEYWFPWRRLFGRPFWIGAASGLLAIAAVIGLMIACGSARIASAGAYSPALFGHTLLWVLTFLLVGISEELGFRGYALFALSAGGRFWRSAITMSIVFMLPHLPNAGETPIGLADVVAVGLVFCYALWQFGDLRWLIGFHAAWDFGQTALFGTQDSGLFATGSLLHTTTSGPDVLSGGAAGPEGTIFALAVLAATAYLIQRFSGGQPALAANR